MAIILSIFLLTVVVILSVARPATTQDTNSPTATATFNVDWHDVGKAALDGLKGIKRIQVGWNARGEIDAVTYDPAQITLQEMESRLKDVGTYLGTVK